MDRMGDLASRRVIGRAEHAGGGILEHARAAGPLERGNRPVAPRERIVVAEDIRVLADAHVAALGLRI